MSVKEHAVQHTQVLFLLNGSFMWALLERAIVFPRGPARLDLGGSGKKHLLLAIACICLKYLKSFPHSLHSEDICVKLTYYFLHLTITESYFLPAGSPHSLAWGFPGRRPHTGMTMPTSQSFKSVSKQQPMAFCPIGFRSMFSIREIEASTPMP